MSAASNVLLPYALGLVLAYLLLLVVKWLAGHMPRRLRTWGLARPLAIVTTYLVLIDLPAGVLVFADSLACSRLCRLQPSCAM